MAGQLLPKLAVQQDEVLADLEAEKLNETNLEDQADDAVAARLQEASPAPRERLEAGCAHINAAQANWTTVSQPKILTRPTFRKVLSRLNATSQGSNIILYHL